MDASHNYIGVLCTESPNTIFGYAFRQAVLTYGTEGWTLTKADEKRSNQQNCGSTVGCYESAGLNTTHIA